MIKLTDLLKEEFGGGEYKLPKDHKPGMKVPKGGACCANCSWYEYDEEHELHVCNNKYYEKWAETKVIPYAPNEYCSDWWQPAV